MFISYFEPIYFRGRRDVSIPFFYKQIEEFGIDNCCFITNDDYFKSQQEWEYRNLLNLSEFSQRFNSFSLCDDETLSKCNRYIVPEEIFNSLFERIGEDKLLGEKILLTEIYEPLQNYFDNTIGDIISKNDVEAIITVKNNPSLESIAKKYDIPIIHYETAGLRPFDYQYLMYFDYKGVNGRTSADELFNAFQNEYHKNPVKLLTTSEILELFKRSDLNMEYLKAKEPEYEVGGALQLFDDSNIIAFSNNYNSEKLIDLLTKYYRETEILIRNHPCTKEEKLLSFKNLDTSPHSAEFISRCEKIVTINSSVAYEAALYDKPVYILGDSPFKMLSEDISTLKERNLRINNNFMRKLKINYLTFVYMIPFELFFDLSYLRYRLTNPGLTEIFNYHIEYYKKKQKELNLNKINHLEDRINSLNSEVSELKNTLYQIKDKKNSLEEIKSIFRKLAVLFRIK